MAHRITQVLRCSLKAPGLASTGGKKWYLIHGRSRTTEGEATRLRDSATVCGEDLSTWRAREKPLHPLSKNGLDAGPGSDLLAAVCCEHGACVTLTDARRAYCTRLQSNEVPRREGDVWEGRLLLPLVRYRILPRDGYLNPRVV